MMTRFISNQGRSSSGHSIFVSSAKDRCLLDGLSGLLALLALRSAGREHLQATQLAIDRKRANSEEQELRSSK